MDLLRLKRIVNKYLSGHASVEEKAIMEQWFKDAREAADKEVDKGQFDERKAIVLSNIKAIMETRAIKHVNHFPKNKLRYLQWTAAACILSLLVAGYLFRGELGNMVVPPAMYTVVTNQHQVKEVILPDSSIVVLNINSQLRYPASFDGSRSVELNGEAFFDVKKNSNASFIVKASHLNVQVLGTSFIVSDASAYKLASIGVKTGRVQISVPGGQKELSPILSPHQQFTYIVRDRNGKIEKNIPVNTEWTSQLLVFRNTPLSEVFAAIAESMHVKIVSNNHEINKRTFTGSFLKEDNLSEMLKILSVSYGLKIKQVGNQLEIN
ncbi:MAG: FecR domain-containing protein [Chitinophaga sp.]|uniref:FecR family protein n=1 Tax=Chitinophaga sp. TaxID=1869181 RepID=UPI0025BE5CC1|nr:FecR domain-containing protein [Chitinophaga sp.]MBV8252002.1 FecR domain-containing protein [Chitinophaga sp.]